MVELVAAQYQIAKPLCDYLKRPIVG